MYEKNPKLNLKKVKQISKMSDEGLDRQIKREAKEQGWKDA